MLLKAVEMRYAFLPAACVQWRCTPAHVRNSRRCCSAEVCSGSDVKARIMAGNGEGGDKRQADTRQPASRYGKEARLQHRRVRQ